MYKPENLYSFVPIVQLWDAHSSTDIKQTQDCTWSVLSLQSFENSNSFTGEINRV